MPTIHISINIERENSGSFKHFLNDKDYRIYSSKEDDKNFTMMDKTKDKEEYSGSSN